MTALLLDTPVHPSVVWLSDLLDRVGSQPAGANPRQCVAHEDSNPSLTVTTGCQLYDHDAHKCSHDGDHRWRAYIRCWKGCRPGQILTALRLHYDVLTSVPAYRPDEHVRRAQLHLNLPDLDPEHRGGHPSTRQGWRWEAHHPYGDRWVLERWRGPAGRKELVWHTRDQAGALIPGLRGTSRRHLPLYRQPEVDVAVAVGEPVLLVESESSVDALTGWYATTWAGGAEAIPLGHLVDILGDHNGLVVIPDNDDPGLRALDRLHRHGLAQHILLPQGAGEDARDLHRRLGPVGFGDAVREALTRTRASA